MRILRWLSAFLVVVLGCGALAAPASARGTSVAELTIVSDSSAMSEGESTGYFGGHTFLVVKNISSSPIPVGLVQDVKPGESITVGTWGNKSEHKGVWYNLESYIVQKWPDAYANAVSLTQKITQKQLNSLNDYIRGHDSHGGDSYGAAYNNCASFATGAWNRVMPWNMWVLAAIPPGFPTPTGAYYYIEQNGAHKYGFDAPWSGRGVRYAGRHGVTTGSSEFVLDESPVTSDIVGPGVTVLSSETGGSDEQWAHVDGMAAGARTWVLSTGIAADAVGDPSSEASTDLSGPGNPRLSALSGSETYDAAAYTVSLRPSGDRLHIRYVFASEEYPEYVDSRYNDVMAVFVNGVNCAKVPGSEDPVAINSINHLRNTQWYVDNTSGASGYSTVYDGLTKPLECSVPVTPGQAVTVEIAVADTSDGVLDSGVAILDRGIWAD